MNTRLLSDVDFHATFTSPMRDVTADGDAVADIWPYIASIPVSDLAGTSLVEGVVEHVYQTNDGRLDQVLIPTTVRNIYLVVVVARTDATILGHHLLNLNEKYGLPDPRT